MLRNYIIRDISKAGVLLIGCLIAGLIINRLGPAPLPLIYSSPEVRFHQITQESSPVATVSIVDDEGVNRDEVLKITLNHTALIVDARPEKSYRLGHIPSAVSLPRDDFDKQYQALESILQSHRNEPLIVYCSNFHCLDSQTVAAKLQRLGCQHIRLFHGGWDDWQTANLSEEK